MANIPRNLVPNQREKINNAGQYIRVESAESAVTIYVNGDYHEVEEGANINTDSPFASFEVASDVVQSVVLMVTNDTVDSNNIAGEVSIRSSDRLVPLPHLELTGGVDVIPGNPNRSQLEIYSNTGNSDVWIGGVVEQGIPLKADGIYQPMVTGDILVKGTAGDKLFMAEIL